MPVRDLNLAMMYSVRLLVITTAILSISWLSWFNELPGSYKSTSGSVFLNISENGTFSMQDKSDSFGGNWNKKDKNTVVFFFKSPKSQNGRTLTGFIESGGDITLSTLRFRKK